MIENRLEIHFSPETDNVAERLKLERQVTPLTLLSHSIANFKLEKPASTITFGAIKK